MKDLVNTEDLVDLLSKVRPQKGKVRNRRER